MMKTITWLLAVVCFVALLGCGESDRTPEASVAEASNDVVETTEQVIAAFVPRADQFGLQQFKVAYQLDGQETGTRTLWVENYGEKVGMEENLTMFGQKQHKLYYWDGEQSHLKDLPDGEVFSTPFRAKTSEPTSFATTPASSLEMAGYERLGEKSILNMTCEHWKNDQFNYEGCRWKNIELEFHNGAGTANVIQTTVATEIVDGEGIPDRIKEIAP